MKKKLLVLVCMITCILGLTACGTNEQTEYEQWKTDSAKQVATTVVIPLMEQFTDPSMEGYFDGYTGEEVEYVIEQQVGIQTDGYAFINAISSFDSALEVMGGIQSIGNAEATMDGKQIVVEVEVIGNKKNATAEVIVSNDMFLKLKSASLNPVNSMGDLMSKAGLDTLIGMLTVFVVLILISLIISCFSIIPKIQDKMAKAKEAKKSENTGIDNAVAQITAQEEVTDGADDLELVAVIAAAIAASEGAASTDGFVVRSIRRRA